MRMALTRSLTCRRHIRSSSVCDAHTGATFRIAQTENGLYWIKVLSVRGQSSVSSSLTDGGVGSCLRWPLSLVLLLMSSEQRVLASSPTANRGRYSYFAPINHSDWNTHHFTPSKSEEIKDIYHRFTCLQNTMCPCVWVQAGPLLRCCAQNNPSHASTLLASPSPQSFYACICTLLLLICSKLLDKFILS